MSGEEFEGMGGYRLRADRVVRTTAWHPPLAVLVVTIAGGALFGTIGLILAAPLVSAITRISADLARVRASEDKAVGTDPATGAQPAPAQ